MPTFCKASYKKLLKTHQKIRIISHHRQKAIKTIAVLCLRKNRPGFAKTLTSITIHQK